jgi:hypothetical protein
LRCGARSTEQGALRCEVFAHHAFNFVMNTRRAILPRVTN